MEELLQYSPEELEQQRMRAQQLRGVGIFGGSSQIPGVQESAQQDRGAAMQQMQLDQKLNQAELGDRRDRQQQGLRRAADRKVQDFAEMDSNREFARQGERDIEEDAQYRRSQALDETTMETQTYENADGDTMEVSFRWSDEYERLVPRDPYTNDALSLDGWKKTEKSYLGSGGRMDNTTGMYRFQNPDTGEEMMLTKRKDGKMINVDTQEVLAPGAMEGYIRQDAMTEYQQERYLTKMNEAMLPALELLHDIEAAEDTFVEAGMEEGEDPLNYLTKQVGGLGDMFRVIDDIGEDGAPTQNAFAAMQTVYNTITRLRAGLSQTVSEIENIRRETGQNPMQSPQAMMAAWDRLRPKLENDISLVMTAGSPRMLKEAARRRNSTGVIDLGSGGPLKKATRGGRGVGANANKPKTAARADIESQMSELDRREAELNARLGR